MDSDVTFAGVALIPLIVGLIQFLKRIAGNVEGNIWLGLSMLLGIAGMSAVYLAEQGAPADFQGWLSMVILGLAFGLAASKAYDETLGK